MNPIKRAIRNFIIGTDRFITSSVLYRNAMLRGLIAMVAILIGASYIVIDYVNNIRGGFTWYVLLIIFASLIIWLNKRQYYIWANVTVVIVSNGIVYVFASSETPAGGIFFFFLVTGLITLVLFGYRYRNFAFILVAITYLIAMLAYTQLFPLKPYIEFPPEYSTINFITNFTTAYLVAILITYFSIQLHHDTEADLRTSEQSLLMTSEELKRSRERFKMAVEGSRSGIYEWNRHVNAIYIGLHYKKMLGYEDDDLQNITFEKYFEMIHPEDRDRFNKSLETHKKTREPYQTELRIRTKGGSYKWVSDSGVSQFDDKGEQVLVVGSIIDIDERKMAERQIRLQNDLLAKANDELDRFVYSASHDLRAPLSSLLGLISIAELTDKKEEVALCLEMMKKRVLTMEGFIKEITDYSRNSRLGVVKQAVAVSGLVQEVADNLKFTSGTERLAIQMDIDPSLVFITDVNRLKVILNNLIANAIKYHDYSKANPYIKVSAFTNHQHHVLSVIDNGLGIAPEHIEKIFNMFYRASENSEGSGLGLYIAKETLAKLQGEIEVQSKQFEGSTFTIFLPVS